MKRLVGALIGLCAALVVASSAFLGWSFPSDLELRLLDVRFRLRGEAEVSGEVGVVAIDAASIEQIGRWPWSRDTMAQLIRNLCDAGAASISLDIVFGEPEEDQARNFASTLLDIEPMPAEARSLLQALRSKPTGDEALASAIHDCDGRVILGYFFRSDQSLATGEQDPALFAEQVTRPVAIVHPRSGLTLPQAAAIENNIPVIFGAARHHGFFNMRPDPDGQLRHYQLLWTYGEDYYPSLALEAVRTARGNTDMRLKVSDLGAMNLTIGDHLVQSDIFGRQLIDFRGPGETFPYISALDILQGEPVDIKDKILFVGVTEVGVKDVRPTSVDPLFPGTEIHATLADSILRQRFLHRSEFQNWIDLLTILLLGICLGAILQRVDRASLALAIAALVAFAYCAVNQLAFVRMDLWLNAIYPLATITGTWAGISLWRTLVVERRAREIRGVFQKYVAASVVEEMLGDPDRVRLGGERKDLSVLFSDIRGFTSISENMDPQALVQFLNAYFTPMTQIILNHRGTFDKYMGDAMMAFWGAPLAIEDHAVQCSRAALAMQSQLEIMKKEHREVDMSNLDIGIGINTGPVSVGNMGSEQIYDYTVIGDAANLASRLEGINKNYGTRIVISEFTREAIRESGFVARRLDRVQVKGKAQPVLIYELLGEGDPAPWSDLLKAFESGLDHYFAGRFEEAVTLFQAASEIEPTDAPSQLYAERCLSYLALGAPENWDGVHVMDSK